MSASVKPVVFILNLDRDQMYEGLFDSIYADLIESLSTKYRLQRARALGAAERYLANSKNQPVAILVTDPAIVEPENSTILSLVKKYVTAGGIVIFAASFSSFIDVSAIDAFWKNHWDVDWKRGDYHRTDVYLNRDVPQLSISSLEKAYSQKAVFLDGVSRNNSLYLPSSSSMTQSLVFPSEPVDQQQTPVAFTKVGNGWMGYIGDVNNEKGSQAVIHAMVDLGVKQTTRSQ